MVPSNLKNPSVVPVPDPIDLDIALLKLQTRIASLPWMEKSFGRAFEIPRKSSDGKTVTREPMIYVGNSEYYPAFPNDALMAYSFFHCTNPRQTVDYAPHSKNIPMTTACALIVWGNHKRVDPDRDMVSRERLINDVISVVSMDSTAKVLRVFDENSRDIFRGFTINESHQGLLMHPYFAFRIELEVSFKVQCNTIPVIPYVSGGTPFIDTLLRIPGGIASALKSIFVKDTETPLKLSQTKVGVGTITDVEDALKNNRRILIYKKNTHTSVTGTIAETIHDSILIPGNTFQPNDIINIVAVATKTGTAGNFAIRVRHNTTPTMPAGNIIAFSQSGTQSIAWNKLAREILCRNAMNSQISFNNLTSSPSDVSFTAAAPTEPAIDFTQDHYIILTTQNGNAGDTVTFRGWYLEIIR